MVQGLIGKKIGMTQIFDDLGNVVPVTVIQAGPCVVVQVKHRDTDGYEAVQLGLVETGRRTKVTRPLEGHFKRAGVPPTRVLREVALDDEGDSPVEVGQNVFVQDVFQVDSKVSVTGISKGRGFQGVVKRHGFRGGRATHGSMFHRAPGSIGQSASPSRVFPGLKAPGQMGNSRVTQRKLKVVRIDEENNLLLVRGSVPGSNGNYVLIKRS